MQPVTALKEVSPRVYQLIFHECRAHLFGGELKSHGRHLGVEVLVGHDVQLQLLLVISVGLALQLAQSAQHRK